MEAHHFVDYLQNFIHYPAVKMQRKLLGIFIVDFDATGQLLILYYKFGKFLRKNVNTMSQYFSSL